MRYRGENPDAAAFENFLSDPCPEFGRRRSLHRFLRHAPEAVRMAAAKKIWHGPWRHLLHFDHDVSIDRGASGLSRLHWAKDRRLSAVPLDALVKIDRPVTLVAAGPSAHRHDWAAVRRSGRFIAVVTGAATIARSYGAMPELIIVSDPRFCPLGGRHILDAPGVPLGIEYRAASVLANTWPGAIQDRPVALLERVNRWYGKKELGDGEFQRMNAGAGYPYRFTADRQFRDGWSHRPALGIFPSTTVAFVALQVLVGLGATDIEIIGMDLGGGTSAYENAGPSWMERNYDRSLLPSFLTMRDALSGSGVRIRNLSPVCSLPGEVFQS